MNARSGNAILEEATRELDASIEVRFTEANFSFAMAALLAKNMPEEHLCNHAVGQSRLRNISISFLLTSSAALVHSLVDANAVMAKPCVNGHASRVPQVTDHLGYTISLLAATPSTGNTDGGHDLSGSSHDAGDGRNPLLPDILDIENNVCSSHSWNVVCS
jgi:hypothetical protein